MKNRKQSDFKSSHVLLGDDFKPKKRDTGEEASKEKRRERERERIFGPRKSGYQTQKELKSEDLEENNL